MIAGATGVKEIEITEAEAAKLAGAVQNVSKYYPVAIDPKSQAWIGLIMVAGGIYGSRVGAWYFASQTAKNTPAEPAADPGPDIHAVKPVVVPFGP
jgi:hypothetical protein